MIDSAEIIVARIGILLTEEYSWSFISGCNVESSSEMQKMLSLTFVHYYLGNRLKCDLWYLSQRLWKIKAAFLFGIAFGNELKKWLFLAYFS